MAERLNFRYNEMYRLKGGLGDFMEYAYKLENFEGPLDLLLHLIEKHKIDIYDIPIVSITSQYFSYLETWKRFDIQYSSEFLVMAATLLQIKSRMLLPARETVEEETEDPRDELVQKLMEYKQIKAFSEIIGALHEENDAVFAREEKWSEWGTEAVFTLENTPLYTIFFDVLHKKETLPKEASIPSVIIEKEAVTIDMAKDALLEWVDKNTVVPLGRYLWQQESREWLVMTFLALLELLKIQILQIQDNHGDFIIIKGEEYD